MPNPDAIVVNQERAVPPELVIAQEQAWRQAIKQVRNAGIYGADYPGAFDVVERRDASMAAALEAARAAPPLWAPAAPPPVVPPPAPEVAGPPAYAIPEKHPPYGFLSWAHKVKPLPRTDFLQSIAQTMGGEARDVVDVLSEDHDKRTKFGGTPTLNVDPLLYELAADYVRYRGKDARLPKFGRWATGLFPKNEKLVSELAKAGQQAVSGAQLVLSVEPYDILRCGQSAHFASCFKQGDTYRAALSQTAGSTMPLYIVENIRGLAIAFVNDPTGEMQGRAFIVHAKRKDNGQDVAVILPTRGSGLSMPYLKECFKAAGIPHLVTEARGATVPVDMIEIPKEHFYFDYQIYSPAYKVYEP